MCVLLVEDDLDIREIVEESLIEAGLEVLSAPNGEAAVEMIQTASRPFTFLVTDFHMSSHVNGFDVAGRFRTRWPAAPVVIASGRPEAFQSSWALDYGYRLLKKPYAPSELVTLIHAMRDQPSDF